MPTKARIIDVNTFNQFSIPFECEWFTTSDRRGGFEGMSIVMHPETLRELAEDIANAVADLPEEEEA